MAASLATMTGAILAGGFGTRLRPRLADRPKSLAPVHGRPYITYLLDQLAAAGLREVVLLTGHLAEQVYAALGESYGGLRLFYSLEPGPRGTAGALRWALPKLTSTTVLLMNGDSYCDVSLPAFAEFHARQGAEVSLVLAQVEDAGRYGQVRTTPDGLVAAFEEKQASAGPGWINAGIYLIHHPRIEDVPPDRPVSLEREMFPAWAARGRLAGYRCQGRFLDIGTPESYNQAEAFFRPRRAA
jgi:NDP-sugar pyrophosphorylase family protein